MRKIFLKKYITCFSFFAFLFLQMSVSSGSKQILCDELVFCELGTSMPSFPGGNEALFGYISYKSESVMAEMKVMNRLSGKVNIAFFVEPDGSISSISIEKSTNPYLDPIAVKVIEDMPKWIPGTQNGKPVRAEFKLPLIFR